jgi:predicted GNAT superfamily acetyltransferase
MTQPELVYRACNSIEDFRQCVRLQEDIWGFAELEVLPTRVFIVAHHIGGQIFAAFEERGWESRMAGFLLAQPGVRSGKPFLHSHMLGVMAQFRNRGVGRRLKLMQRDDALARGIPLVEWTFDPLEPKNAFFNIVRLGAVARRYAPNRYGITTAGLHAGLPTDRLIAEWFVDTERVRQTLEGSQAVNQAFDVERRIEVPPDIVEIKKHNRAGALEVQARIRAEFADAFTRGLVVAGFDPKGAYLLAREESLDCGL